MIYLQLFYTFFKNRTFRDGGGYAMLSMIQGEVVTRYGWVTSQEFTDIVAISQMTPGPIGINAGHLCRFHIYRQCMGIDCSYICSCFSFFHTDADNQQILSEISETSRSRILCFCRTASGSCRIIGFRRTGIDEYGKFLFTQRRHLLFYHQHHHLPGNLYRHQKIQDQSDINDNCLRNCRSIILLNDE